MLIHLYYLFVFTCISGILSDVTLFSMSIHVAAHGNLIFYC